MIYVGIEKNRVPAARLNEANAAIKGGGIVWNEEGLTFELRYQVEFSDGSTGPLRLKSDSLKMLVEFATMLDHSRDHPAPNNQA